MALLVIAFIIKKIILISFNILNISFNQVSFVAPNSAYLVLIGCKPGCKDYFEVDSATGQASSVLGSSFVGPNTWYHLAFVYSGTNAYIYLNGTLSASSSAFVSSSTINANRITNMFGSYNGYAGSVTLDEIKLYNKALSQTQVQLDMNTVGLVSSGIC
jgi:hypothetical protein